MATAASLRWRNVSTAHCFTSALSVSAPQCVPVYISQPCVLHHKNFSPYNAFSASPFPASSALNEHKTFFSVMVCTCVLVVIVCTHFLVIHPMPETLDMLVVLCYDTSEQA